MEKLRSRIDAVVGLLQANSHLLSSHMVEFFTGSLFEQLPATIKNQIVSCEPGEILDIFWQHGRGQFIGSDSPLGSFLNNILSVVGSLACKPEEVVPVNRAVHLKSFVSAKKGHEIAALGRAVAGLADIAGVSHVVDVGAGKGYLSAHLAIHYDLNVLGIDCSHSKTASAVARTKKMERAGMNRKTVGNKIIDELLEQNIIEVLENSKEDLKGSYKQITQTVNQHTCLTSIAKEQFQNSSLSGIGLISLHGCGSLSPSLVQHYSSEMSQVSTSKSFLAIVPCCYHLLESWPQSSYMHQIGFTLPENALMHACKPLPKLAASQTVGGEILMWRAILQVILQERFGNQRFKVGRIASKANSFQQYIKIAIKKLQIDLMLSDAEIENYYLRFKDSQLKLDVYFLILASLATAVEALILLDLLLLLKEKGVHESWLVQLFDPVISPRSHALIALSS